MEIENSAFLSNKKTASVVLMWGITITTLFLSIFLIAQTMKTFRGSNENITHTITVSGRGEVISIPNIATFSYTISEVKEDVLSAQNLVAERNNELIDLLKNNEINERDIRTTSYQIRPKYEWQAAFCPPERPCLPSRNVLIGQEVSHTVQVKVREMSKVGEILSLVGQKNVSNLTSLDFTIEDRDAVLAEAREKAISDAKEKAEILSKQLGVRIVGIVDFREDAGHLPVEKFEMMDTRMVVQSSIPEIPAGENLISSSVQITFEIRN